MDKILSDIQTRIAEIIKEQKAKGVYGNDPIQKEAMKDEQINFLILSLIVEAKK
jgi:hypothetical protein